MMHSQRYNLQHIIRIDTGVNPINPVNRGYRALIPSNISVGGDVNGNIPTNILSDIADQY